MSTTHHAIARPEFEELAHSPTDNTPKKTSKTRLSTRKVRSDAGIPKGPRKPRKDAVGSYKNGYWKIPLTGVHGRGKYLLISARHHSDLMLISENGKRINVDWGGTSETHLRVRISGPLAAKYAKNSNPSHQLTLQRFLSGEEHSGRIIRHINGNPFDNREENLDLEIKSSKKRFPIDWPVADEMRQARLASILNDNEGPAILN